MSCQNCKSNRIMSITGKCNDTCGGDINNVEFEGYVPKDLGIGGGDYIEFSYCLNCGQIQGKFPLPVSGLEEKISKEEFLQFYENYFTQGKLFSGDTRHIIRAAQEYGADLKNFIEKYFYWNDTLPMPSSLKMWEMYEKNNYELEYL